MHTLDCESWSVDELLEIAKDDEEIQHAWKHLRFGYTETAGLPALRNVCAEQLGMSSREDILMFAGAEEGIFCTFRTLLTKEDHVIVFTPCYQSLLSIPEACAGEVSRFDLNAEDNWSVDIEKLAAMIQPQRTKLIVMNFPHNPTGTIVPVETMEAIVSLAERYSIYLFCDEIYKGIDRLSAEINSNDDNSNNNLLFRTIASRYAQRGITLSGVSKSHGLPGLRIGWIACQDHALLHRIAENKHYLSICNSAPSEIFAWIAVKYRSVLWARNRRIIEANEALFIPFLAKYAHILSWSRPSGGCCAFVRFLNINNSSNNTTSSSSHGLTLSMLAETMVSERGLLILPGCNFPCSAAMRSTVDTYMRIGLGRKSFPEALRVLEECLIAHCT